MRIEVEFEILEGKKVVSVGHPSEKSSITFLTDENEEFEIKHIKGNHFEIDNNYSNFTESRIKSIVKLPEANGTLRIITQHGSVDFIWGDIDGLIIEKIIANE